MKTPEIDKRLIKAIIKGLKMSKGYVVPFSYILDKLREMVGNEGETYRLGSELYVLLKEGKINNAYLIEGKYSRVVVTPLGLTSEQLLVLREVGQVYTTNCPDCENPIDSDCISEVINALVNNWSRRDNLIPSPAFAVYMLAKNNGLSINTAHDYQAMAAILSTHPGEIRQIQRFDIEGVANVTRLVHADNNMEEWVFG
jgi:hypothetical protein